MAIGTASEANQAVAGDPARVVTIADMDAAAHGVHLFHGAPADETGASTVPHADPLALHGLATAAAPADEEALRIPVAAAFPLTEAAHERGESRHAPGRIVLVP